MSLDTVRHGHCQLNVLLELAFAMAQSEVGTSTLVLHNTSVEVTNFLCQGF